MPEVIFDGPCGRIEGVYHHNPSPSAPLAIVLHPHPQHGGTMNNKVVFTLYRAFADSGFSVVRFNFRGVGRSEGECGKGDGEIIDATAALDWIQMINPGQRDLWVSGFSFGGWIAMQILMRRPEIRNFVTAAPPANLYDFNFLAPCPASGIIIQGADDNIVSVEDVTKLVNKIHSQKRVVLDYVVMENADHFFSGKLDILADRVKEYLLRELVVAKAQLKQGKTANVS
ncbi:MAG: alpha/beta hydrolase [Holosporales bacterium]|jgi:alpha/beta superfamily hydrolase|nr:alpha/beta hydrolase [Holosporales bacterium]